MRLIDNCKALIYQLENVFEKMFLNHCYKNVFVSQPTSQYTPDVALGHSLGGAAKRPAR